MSCLHFKNAATGEDYYVQALSGVSIRHRPGDVLVGVEATCSSNLNAVIAAEPTQTLQQELNDAIGSGAGDWIKTLVSPFAKLIGKKSCSICEARRLATNAYAKLKVKYGQVEALRIMKELWEDSFAERADPNAILLKLQGYLDAQ